VLRAEHVLQELADVVVYQHGFRSGAFITAQRKAHPQPPEEGVRSESGDWISGDVGSAEGGRLLGGAVCSLSC
jgi:hypothetical protein